MFPVHQLVIRGDGIALLEGLAPLAPASASALLFVAAPLPRLGETGSALVAPAIPRGREWEHSKSNATCRKRLVPASGARGTTRHCRVSYASPGWLFPTRSR